MAQSAESIGCAQSAQSAKSAKKIKYKTMNRHNCRYCIGASQEKPGAECTALHAGCVCDITHNKITEREMENGCENFYDNRGTAYLIDVRSNYTYYRMDKEVGSDTFTDRVVRVRNPPASLDDWRQIYTEALNYRIKYLKVEGTRSRWVCGNVYRFYVGKCSTDSPMTAADTVREVKVTFCAYFNSSPEVSC